MKGASQLAPVGIRIPDDLKSHIQARAQDNGRSMNAEIIDAIERSFLGEENQNIHTMHEQISHLIKINELNDKIIESQKGTISALESSVSTLEQHVEMLNKHIEFLTNLLSEKKPE